MTTYMTLCYVLASHEVRMPSVKRIATVLCEATVLSAAVVAVWVLIFIPVILYFTLVSDDILI